MPALRIVTQLAEQDDVALASVARGDVLYRGASSWQNLAAGTAGKVLQSNGAGADPTWETVSGGAAAWTDNGTNVQLSNAARPVGLGIVPVSRLHVAAGGFAQFDVPGGTDTGGLLWRVAGTAVADDLPASGHGVKFYFDRASNNLILAVRAGGADKVLMRAGRSLATLAFGGSATPQTTIFTVFDDGDASHVQAQYGTNTPRTAPALRCLGNSSDGIDGGGGLELGDGGVVRLRLFRTGSNVFRISTGTVGGGHLGFMLGGSLGLNTDAEFGSGVGCFGIQDAGTIPTTNPATGGVLYSQAGSLRWRGSSGTVTTLAPA